MCRETKIGAENAANAEVADNTSKFYFFRPADCRKQTVVCRPQELSSLL